MNDPSATSISVTSSLKSTETMARLSFIVAIIGMALMCVLAQEHYSDQYDYVDAKAILANDKLRNQYYDCFMDAGPCVTADQKFFRDLVLEAVSTKCQKCTEKQKQMLDDVTDWYTKNDNEKWNKLIERAIEEAKKKNANR